MEDHELIELAAAAAGIKYDADASKPKEGRQWWGLWKTFDREPSEYDKRYWNPLRDDGDAFRLAVDLNMQIAVGDTSHALSASDAVLPTGEHATQLHAGDPRYATRRAIVRAAAMLPPNA